MDASAPDPAVDPTPLRPTGNEWRIFFAFRTARLGSDAKVTLDELGQGMKEEPLRTLDAAGYTAADEPDADALSLARATAAYNYLLTRHGIDPVLDRRVVITTRSEI